MKKILKSLLFVTIFFCGVFTVKGDEKIDLSAYSAMNMNVYENSRVTEMKSNANGTITLSGYMFNDSNCNKKNSLYREVIFVNENDPSTAKAYRQEVVSKYNTFLNGNATATQNGKYDLSYAFYDVTVNPKSIMNYSKTSKGSMANGSYLAYMRISDGKTSYLFPLKDAKLSDGSTMESKGTLPKGFEVINPETRELRYVVTSGSQEQSESVNNQMIHVRYEYKGDQLVHVIAGSDGSHIRVTNVTNLAYDNQKKIVSTSKISFVDDEVFKVAKDIGKNSDWGFNINFERNATFNQFKIYYVNTTTNKSYVYISDMFSTDELRDKDSKIFSKKGPSYVVDLASLSETLGKSTCTDEELLATKNVEELKAKVNTIQDVLNYIKVKKMKPGDGDRDILYDSLWWSYNNTPEETFKLNKANCGGIANFARYLLEENYDIGYINYLDMENGGHVINYVKYSDVYYMIDLTHPLNGNYDYWIWQADSEAEIVDLTKRIYADEKDYVKGIIYITEIKTDHPPLAHTWTRDDKVDRVYLATKKQKVLYTKEGVSYEYTNPNILGRYWEK